MKRIYIGLVAVAALCLAGCNGLAEAILNTGNSQPTIVNSGAPAETGVTSTTRADEALLFAAEAAYNVPADAYVTLNRAGQLPPAIKASAKAFLMSAYARLQDARRLYRLGNARDFRTAANAAIGLANSARAALPADAPFREANELPANMAAPPAN